MEVRSEGWWFLRQDSLHADVHMGNDDILLGAREDEGLSSLARGNPLMD